MQIGTIARSVVGYAAVLAVTASIFGSARAASTPPSAAPAGPSAGAPAAQSGAAAPTGNAPSSGSPTAQQPQEPPIKVKQLVQEKLPNAPGNSLTALEVDVGPGATMEPHHHAGFVFAYVISGKIRSQLNKEEPKTYKSGQSWTEAPGTLHATFQNASHKKKARLIAVFIAPDGAELTTNAK